MIIRNKKITILSDVELSDKEVDQIIIGKLYKLFNWGSEYFIKDRQVWTTREYATSHRFDMDEVVRPASDEDYQTEIMINNILQKMKES